MDANAYNNYYGLWGEPPPPPTPSARTLSQPPQDINASSQVILSGVPPGVTASELIAGLRMSYGVENVSVSVRNDGTAVVSGLSLHASEFLISLGTIMFNNYVLKVRSSPQIPSRPHSHPHPQQSWPGGFVRPVYERNASYVAGSPGFPAGFGHPEAVPQGYGNGGYPPEAAQGYGGGGYLPDVGQGYGGGGGGGGGGGANTRLERQFLSPTQYDQHPFFQDAQSAPGINSSPQSDWKVSRRRSTTTITTTPPIRSTTPTPMGPASLIDPLMPIDTTTTTTTTARPLRRPPSRNDFIQEYQSSINLQSEREGFVNQIPRDQSASVPIYKPNTDAKSVCPVCEMVFVTNDNEFVNNHVDNCLSNLSIASSIAASVAVIPNNPTSGRENISMTSTNDSLFEWAEIMKTSLLPKSEEDKTVYLLDVPQAFDDVYIINKFSMVFGEVHSCTIGHLTQVCTLKFASRESAENALAAESIILQNDNDDPLDESLNVIKIRSKVTVAIYVGGTLGNVQLTSLENHLSGALTGSWSGRFDSGIQDFLCFDCNLEAAEKALSVQSIPYDQQILTFYAQSGVVYLEELPPTATSDKIASVLQDLLPTLGSVNVVVNSEEGVAVVMLTSPWLKKQLLALENIQIDNKIAMITPNSVPKVYMEDIPDKLLQQSQDALHQAILTLPIFEGMVTHVELRTRDRIAILSLTNTEARACILTKCQSIAPVLQGYPVLIRPVRAMAAVLEFDDEWYQRAQVHQSTDQYATDDSVLLRGWRPELWKQWIFTYTNQLEEATNINDAEEISHAKQKINGVRVTAMLSTLAAIHNGYYCPSEDPTKRVDISPPSQPSESFTIATLPPVSTASYDRTSVSVVKDDCLLTALNMKERGFRPVVLNMASATSPGGGYRKGDDSQEENIFRRSNYYQSLGDPKNPRRPIYPIAEFGGIYTPDITVFRDSEYSGYAFRQTPFTMDFIAVAAYQEPKLENDCLSNEDAAKTRRKIEAIFAIALHKGHDSLILSALGCGALRNPPKHIAAIFLAVAQQYSGRFKRIVFAVPDDHKKIGISNHEIFSHILDLANLGPSIPILPPVVASTVPTCIFGGRCPESDATHTKDRYHPPFCPLGKDCKTTDDYHLFLFRHVQPCKQKGLCVQYDELVHAVLFSHPPHCQNGGECTLVEDAHLEQFLHLPVCPDGMSCLLREVASHTEHFRHIRKRCPDGTFCTQYWVEIHMDQYIHPFNTPCHDTPFGCTSKDVKHTAKFSHFCKYGEECHELSDPDHLKNSIHVGRVPCPHGNTCTLPLDEEHLDLYSHSKFPAIRLRCKFGQACTRRSQVSHVSEYAHPSDGPPISSYVDASQDINFSSNAQEIIKVTDAYFAKKGNFKVPDEIVEWVKALRPAHRVRPKIFKSILAHHHLMSADHILKLVNPMWASHEARHHPLVKQICESNSCSETERTYLEDLVQYAVLVAYGKATNDPQLPTWEAELNLKIEAVSSQFLTGERIKPLIDLGDVLVKATRELAANPEGINYEVDKFLGTNKQVFSILGPHTGYYYGDIILLFKPDIMHHPQSNVTPNAATAFWSGREAKNRSFTPFAKPKSDEAVRKFHKSKLHPSCGDWAKAAAADICAQIMETTGKTSLSLDDVKNEWMKRESHFVFEAHLPSLIPLSFVDKIIIPKDVWDNHLTVTDKHQFQLAFPDSNAITVFTDPIGGDVDGQLALTDERRKLMHTAMTHCSSLSTTTGYVHRPLGMSVSLERGNGAILPLPIYFNDAGNGNIYFRAKGNEFFVVLTEKQTKESSNENARLTFFFGGPKSHILYITKSPPAAHTVTLEKKNWLARDQDFDRGFADGDWVNYHIQVDGSNETCMVEHWGHSQIYNRRKLVLSKDMLPANFSLDVRWLGIGAWKSRVSFESIEMYQKPLPEMKQWTPPQMTANASTPKPILPGSFPSAPPPSSDSVMSLLTNNFLAIFQWPTSPTSPTSASTKAVPTNAPINSINAPTNTPTNAPTNAPTNVPPNATTNATTNATINVATNSPTSITTNSSTIPCSFQPFCSKYKDPIHCQNFAHSFVTPCHDMTNCKDQFIESSPHNQAYSHLCRYGNGCRDRTDSEHLRYYIHVRLPRCSDNQNCTNISDWSHREKFHHDGMPSILIPCKIGSQCTKISDPAHTRLYKHI